MPPIFLSLSHTHTLFLSSKMPQGANKCQAVPVHWWLLSPRPDKQGCRLAGCPLPLLTALGPPAAERKSGQQINSCCDVGWATGQAAARHPAHVQGTWPWVNWQMPGLWVRPQSDVTLRVLWPYCTGHARTQTHTHMHTLKATLCLPNVPCHHVFQAPSQVQCVCAHPRFSGRLTHCDGSSTTLRLLAPRKECCNLLLINILKWCHLMHSWQLNHTVLLQFMTALLALLKKKCICLIRFLSTASTVCIHRHFYVPVLLYMFIGTDAHKHMVHRYTL